MGSQNTASALVTACRGKRKEAMKLHRLLGLLIAIQLCALVAAFAQGTYKVEAIGPAPGDVPAPIQTALDTQGVRVSSGQGPLCEVWLSKMLPTHPNPNASSDVLYGALPEGAFVGVLHFPSPATDYRSQTIKAGFYTLRYALIPQDGNHMGVSAYRDAFLLVPVAADTDPAKILTFQDEVKLSKLASGTPHVGFLLGAPVSGTAFPSVVKDDSGNQDLQMKGHGQSGDLPLAFTVVGHYQG